MLMIFRKSLGRSKCGTRFLRRDYIIGRRRTSFSSTYICWSDTILDSRGKVCWKILRWLVQMETNIDIAWGRGICPPASPASRGSIDQSRSYSFLLSLFWKGSINACSRRWQGRAVQSNGRIDAVDSSWYIQVMRLSDIGSIGDSDRLSFYLDRIRWGVRLL